MEILLENDDLIAFYHPQPMYEIHVLMIPKQIIRDFGTMAVDSPFWRNLPAAVHDLVKHLDLEESGYRLITNVGEYQNIRQLHFHLVAGKAI